jgi:hypothetical protein
MCYEFDELYRKAHEAEEARRKKRADELKQPPVPAKRATPAREPQQKEPVPA